MTEASCPICRAANTALHLNDEEEALEPSVLGSSRVKIAHGRIMRCASCGAFTSRKSLVARRLPRGTSEFFRGLLLVAEGCWTPAARRAISCFKGVKPVGWTAMLPYSRRERLGAAGQPRRYLSAPVD
jgi:hypothetical protein